MPCQLRLKRLAATALAGQVTAVLKTDPHTPHQVACANLSRELIRGIDWALGETLPAVLCLAGRSSA